MKKYGQFDKTYPANNNQIKNEVLVFQQNFHTTKIFSDKLLAVETKRTEILMKRLVYTVLSILEISKIDNFIVYIKTEDIYLELAKDLETRLHTSNYELKRPLTKEEKR